MKYSWLFILPIFAIIAIVVYSIYRHRNQRRKSKKAVMVAHSKRVKILPEYEKVQRRYRLLLITAVICFIVSVFSITFTASRPISVDIVEPDYETRDIMLCIDVSGSQAGTITDVVGYFKNSLSKLQGQRVGIAVFADSAAIVSPLTNDYDSLEEILTEVLSSMTSYSFRRNLMTSFVGGGSAIGDGIINCASGFDKLTEEGRAQSIILATDNYQNAGTATVLQAGNYLAQYNVTLYAIDTVKEESSYASARNIRINELRNAAKVTNGLYYNLPAQGIDGSQAASDIMKQEAAKHDSIAQFVQADSPNISTIIAFVSIIFMILIVWRLKL